MVLKKPTNRGFMKPWLLIVFVSRAGNFSVTGYTGEPVMWKLAIEGMQSQQYLRNLCSKIRSNNTYMYAQESNHNYQRHSDTGESYQPTTLSKKLSTRIDECFPNILFYFASSLFSIGQLSPTSKVFQ